MYYNRDIISYKKENTNHITIAPNFYYNSFQLIKLIHKKNYFKSAFHQYFRHMHAVIVSAERLHLFCVMRSAPLEKALSIGTLVANTKNQLN